MAFGHYLRREREGREMTLTELARRVGISIPTYRASSANVKTRRQTT
jgi:transcriptional regulator with XRE-family HTH domain